MNPLTAHTRHIQAEHLKLVLFNRRLHKHSSHPAQPWAALSNGHNFFGSGCPRRPFDEHLQKRLQHPPLFCLANTVNHSLVERVRMHYGAAEVKATWGIGYKAMLKALITPAGKGA